jgi:uncharacterized protein (UPF0264 family)
MSANWNRKLLVSVFNPQEAREAVLGGGRIIDSEDPRSALGNIKPLQIMAIAQSVLDFKRNADVQLSTNIGEDQLLFRRTEAGQAVEKSPYEIAGKAAQAAIGVAASMGAEVHPVSLVKVGLDGMSLDILSPTLEEVVKTLQRTRHYCQSQVMSVLFAQDVTAWNTRKGFFHKELVKLGEFVPAAGKATPDAFSLLEDGVSVGTLKDAGGGALFKTPEEVSLQALKDKGVLPATAEHAWVRPTDLFEQSRYFGSLASGAKTNRAIIQAMVDATAKAGAHGIMLDTSILSKTADICLVDTSGSEMIDFNRHLKTPAGARQGILKLDDLAFFVAYCHSKGVVPNLAGSISSYQAQMLWVLLPELDQLSTRGAASCKPPSLPGGDATPSVQTRQDKIIHRALVRGLAPPELGGVLNLPASLKTSEEAVADACAMVQLIANKRHTSGLPALETYWVDDTGLTTPFEA